MLAPRNFTVCCSMKKKTKQTEKKTVQNIDPGLKTSHITLQLFLPCSALRDETKQTSWQWSCWWRPRLKVPSILFTNWEYYTYKLWSLFASRQDMVDNWAWGYLRLNSTRCARALELLWTTLGILRRAAWRTQTRLSHRVRFKVFEDISLAG